MRVDAACRLSRDVLTSVYRYFHLDSRKHQPLKLQTGTARTNCMDNLDRTNVAQAAFAKWTLNKQLQSLGIFNESETVEVHEELLKDVRESMCYRIWKRVIDYAD